MPAEQGTVEVVNLTQHAVTVLSNDSVIAAWAPSGTFARLVEVSEDGPTLSTVDGMVPVTNVRYAREVRDLPEPIEGTVFVVSRVLAAAVVRDDLFFPAGEVRDAGGSIVGCRSLGQFVTSRAENDVTGVSDAE